MKEIITPLTDWENIVINNAFNCKTKDYDLCFYHEHSLIRILMFNLKDYKRDYNLNKRNNQKVYNVSPKVLFEFLELSL